MGFIGGDEARSLKSTIFYNAKDPHPELMVKALGCSSKQTTTEQKETFNTILRNALGNDEEKYYTEEFGDTPPIVENLIDKKTLVKNPMLYF